MSALDDRIFSALEAHDGLLTTAVKNLMAEAWAEGWLYDAEAVINPRNPYLGQP